jgi:hypothetical protein
MNVTTGGRTYTIHTEHELLKLVTALAYRAWAASLHNRRQISG